MRGVSSRSRPWIGGSLLVIVVALGLVAAHRLAPKHLRTVTPGVLYRSATLPPGQLADVVDRYGIRTVVNVRSELENDKAWHDEQGRLLEEKGVRMLDLPIHSGFPPNDASLAGWLDVLADEGSRPILLHCEYGVIRTGVMVAVYEIEYLGRSGADSWADFELFGGDLEQPIRSRIAEWITRYEPHVSARRAL
jgi:protein tyrosine/serine phosphatase